MKKILCLLACVLYCYVYNTRAVGEAPAQSGPTDTSGYFIDFIIQNPWNEPRPTVLFLHGAEDRGLQNINTAYFDHWVQKGYAVSAISMPGFGKSSGERDFCGPFTIRSLHLAIDIIKNKIGISNLAVIGFGQGALAAALLATSRNDLACVICANGGYDLVRHKTENDRVLSTLQRKGYALDFTNDEALRARSPLYCIEQISAPVFLLHRKGNPIIHEEEAVDFYKAMLAAGKECRIVLRDKLPEDDEMKISFKEILAETESWVDAIMQK